MAKPISSPKLGESAPVGYLPDSGNRGYRVAHYDLDLDYRVFSNRLAATATITAEATALLSRFSLDLVGLSVSKVSINGVRAAAFSQTPTKLIVTPAAPVAAGSTFAVLVRYGGVPAPRRSAWGDVGWEELSDGVLVASQPNGAPTWFPCNDRPDDKATYRIEVATGSAYRVIANGRLASSVARSSKTRWVYEVDEPMATYLATLQIGAYRAHDLPASRVRQQAWIPDELDGFADDFADQAAMISTFERLFGPYPFADYMVVVTDDELEIPLEAQGLSIFGRNHVDGRGGSTRLIAHELAHSWFGNSLTVDDWQHIWLHEGFACYAEWLWSENSGGPSAGRLAAQHRTRLAALPQDFAIGDPGPARMFDDRLYKRGALTLHALRITLGDDAFFRMLRDWTSAHRHGSVNTELFVAHAARYSPAPLDALVRAWLFGHALPALPKG